MQPCGRSDYHLVRLIGRLSASRRWLKIFWDVHFSCITVEGRVVDSNMNGFSSFLATCLLSCLYYKYLVDSNILEK